VLWLPPLLHSKPAYIYHWPIMLHYPVWKALLILDLVTVGSFSSFLCHFYALTILFKQVKVLCKHCAYLLTLLNTDNKGSLFLLHVGKFQNITFQEILCFIADFINIYNRLFYITILGSFGSHFSWSHRVKSPFKFSSGKIFKLPTAHMNQASTWGDTLFPVKWKQILIHPFSYCHLIYCELNILCSK
jgi:hypothetical protein